MSCASTTPTARSLPYTSTTPGSEPAERSRTWRAPKRPRVASTERFGPLVAVDGLPIGPYLLHAQVGVQEHGIGRVSRGQGAETVREAQRPGRSEGGGGDRLGQRDTDLHGLAHGGVHGQGGSGNGAGGVQSWHAVLHRDRQAAEFR